MATGASNGHLTQFEGPASLQVTREGERLEVHAITQGDVADDVSQSPDVRKEVDNKSMDNESMDNESMDNESMDNESMDNESKASLTSEDKDGKENERSESQMSESQSAETIIEDVTQLFHTTCEIQQKDKNGSYTDEFYHHVLQIYLSLTAFNEFSDETMREYMTKVGKILLSSGYVQVLCDTLVDLLQPGVDGQKGLLEAVSTTLLNCTDCMLEVTHAVRDHGRLVPALLDKLKQWMEKELEGFDEHMCQNFLGIPHNLALRDENVAYLRKENTSEVFMLYLQVEAEQLKLIALTTLADIVTDEEADRLATSPELIQFLMEVIRSAFSHRKHHHDGWRFKELLRAVAHLARNDANKLLLVKEGVLPLLLKGIQCQLQEEKDGSMEALWALSLHKHNAKSYLDNEELLDMVVAIYQDKSQSETSRRAAEGILWQLRHELEDTDKYKCTAQALSSKSTPAKKTGHVMLSYQWDHQSLVCKIHDLLQKNGVTVWMDVHKMGCSTRQSMAEGVENSFVVLCCMSPKYKDSPPCRQEAEYADDLRKLIVPLKMERDYKPDGWLGLMMAGKLYYDFSDKNSFDRKFLELLKVIRDILGDVIACGDVMSKDVVDSVKLQPDVVEKVMTHSAPASYRSAKCDVDKIRHWSRDDVQGWMKKFGLSDGLLDTLTGEQIAFLHRLRSEAPEFFYNYLKTDFQMTTLPQLLQMTKALDDLPTVNERLQTTIEGDIMAENKLYHKS